LQVSISGQCNSAGRWCDGIIPVERRTLYSITIKESIILQTKLLWAIFPMAVLISGCAGSPQDQKDEAEAAYIEQQTETIKEYKECIKEAGADQPKLDACESLLKAVKGLTAPAE
jgi:hypothetical protein